MNRENPNSAIPSGTDTDEAVTFGEIEKATERAFEYQRYIARRTFGLFYLAWAAAIALVIAAPDLSALVGVSGHLGETFQLTIRLAALAGAASITAVILRDARRVLILRQTLGRVRAISIYTGGVIFWVYAVVLVYAAVSLYFPAPKVGPAYSQADFYALLLPIPFLLYRLMSLAFLDRRSPERLIALTTFAIAAVISLGESLPKGNSPIHYQTIGWVWAATALVWSLTALYALYRASDEPEALRG